MIGKTLGRYEITALLGKGGMGEVYRATDSELGREVALKLLPKDLNEDAERLARFRREARTLASLQHARIASLFGMEEIDGATVLVMELVEGQNLAERLDSEGALPLEDVVTIAVQMAEGLESAHDNGIMHRDLKPANVKITPQGDVKILDFGLARAFTGNPIDESDMKNSPTVTAALTQLGVILGTAAYMSPEQAKGKSVDRRADIWSYGVILFELLTGRQLFQGETASETMAEVMKGSIDWDTLPEDAPPTLRRLLERCLDRDPASRLRDIGEARVALENLKAGRSDESSPQLLAPPTRSFTRERAVWIVLVLVALAVAGAALLRRPAIEPPEMVQSTLLPPPGWDFAPASPFAVSPDGRQIAFVAYARPDNEEIGDGANAIWIRDLSNTEARRLTACDGNAYPFWSPDGRWIGFFTAGKLNKIEARGGPVIPLCNAADGRGGTWNEEGTIVFQPKWSDGLSRVSAGGGTPEPLTRLDGERQEVAHRWPSFLPDGRHFLFYVVSTTNPSTSEYSGIYVGSLDAGKGRPGEGQADGPSGDAPGTIRMLMRGESRALYAQGHLLYRSGSTLMARPFDPDRLEVTGEAEPLAVDVTGGGISWGGAQFGVSQTGILVHMRGSQAANTQLSWRDREGRLIEKYGAPSANWEMDRSHDGTRLAVAGGTDAGDIWILDLERNMRTRFTFHNADDRSPVWSPDDKMVAYASAHEAEGEIWVRPANGQTDARLLYTAGTQAELSDWSPDGRLILFDHLGRGEEGVDVWALDVESGEAQPLVEGPFTQWGGVLSPDGRYLAYTSDESGEYQVYVQSFPEATGRWMISNDDLGGMAFRPTWTDDGRELLYLRRITLISVPIDAADTFSFGTPKKLFTVNVTTNMDATFDISVDGQRILTNELPAADRDRIGARLIQNWAAERRP